jgi:tetratricopeptide (TPR) repeat protein
MQTNHHPLAALANRIQLAIARQDADMLANMLAGKEVPQFSREGDDPASIIWLCIENYIQPSSPDFFDSLANLQQRLHEQLHWQLSNQSESRQQGNGGIVSSHVGGVFTKDTNQNWLEHEPYVYNLLLLDTLLPAKAQLYGAVKSIFQDTGLSMPVVLQSRAVPILRTAVIKQQTDDSLVANWTEQFVIAIKNIHLQANKIEALTLWRAILLAPTSDGQEINLVSIKRILALFTDDENALLLTESSFVKLLLERLQNIWGGTPRYYRGIFSTANEWNTNSAIQAIVDDVWPLEADVDAHIPNDQRVFWLSLESSTRTKLRNIFRQTNIKELNNFLFNINTENSEKSRKLWGLINTVKQSFPELINKKDINKQEDDESAVDYKSTPITPIHQQFEQISKQILHIEKLLNKDHFNKAIGIFNNIKEQQKQRKTPDKQRAMTACNVADMFKQHNRIDTAFEIYKEAINLFPNDVVARCGLADVLKAQDKFDEAEAQYRSTVSQFPNDVVARCGLADVLKAQDKFDEAEAQYRSTVSQFPNAVVARNGLADVLKAQDKFDEAEAQYRSTVSQFPNDVVARCGLADVLKAQDKFDEAEAQYRSTVSQFPNAVVARNGLANVLRKAGKLVEAKELLTSFVKTNSIQHRYDQIVLALIEIQENDADAALIRLSILLSMTTSPAAILKIKALMASIYLKQKRTLEAKNIMPNAQAMTQVNNDIVKVINFHVSIANKESLALAEIVLGKISMQTKKIKDKITELFYENQLLSANDELFEMEFDLLAA